LSCFAEINFDFSKDELALLGLDADKKPLTKAPVAQIRKLGVMDLARKHFGNVKAGLQPAVAINPRKRKEAVPPPAPGTGKGQRIKQARRMMAKPSSSGAAKSATRSVVSPVEEQPTKKQKVDDVVHTENIQDEVIPTAEVSRAEVQSSRETDSPKATPVPTETPQTQEKGTFLHIPSDSITSSLLVAMSSFDLSDFFDDVPSSGSLGKGPVGNVSSPTSGVSQPAGAITKLTDACQAALGVSVESVTGRGFALTLKELLRVTARSAQFEVAAKAAESEAARKVSEALSAAEANWAAERAKLEEEWKLALVVQTDQWAKEKETLTSEKGELSSLLEASQKTIAELSAQLKVKAEAISHLEDDLSSSKADLADAKMLSAEATRSFAEWKEVAEHEIASSYQEGAEADSTLLKNVLAEYLSPAKVDWDKLEAIEMEHRTQRAADPGAYMAAHDGGDTDNEEIISSDEDIADP